LNSSNTTKYIKVALETKVLETCYVSNIMINAYNDYKLVACTCARAHTMYLNWSMK